MRWKTRAPFGNASKRFTEVISWVPAPGTYDLKPNCSCPFKNSKKTISPWLREHESQEYSKNLGYRFPEVLKQRKYIKSLGGPGTNDVSEDLFRRQSSSVKENVLFGVTERFKSRDYSCAPPPGTYSLIQQSCCRTYGSLKPSFEWDGFQKRDISKENPWTKAPNRYDPLQPDTIKSFAEKKSVSKRGPYDLFTGPRDATTIKNHFSSPTFAGVDKFYPYTTELDHLLTHPGKKWNGKFFQENRWPKKYSLRHLIDDPVLCYRDPDEPGPASHNLRKRKKVKNSLYPFNISAKYVRPTLKQCMRPGVGRYSPKPIGCTTTHPNQSYVFQSKLGREIFKVVEYNSF